MAHFVFRCPATSLNVQHQLDGDPDISENEYEVGREAMTPSEAKLRILAEWRTWVGHQQSAVSHTTAEALAFFKEIEQNKPELLSFDSADKWEFVKSWLLNAGLIKEP
jgi:hypothetical protein